MTFQIEVALPQSLQRARPRGSLQAAAETTTLQLPIGNGNELFTMSCASRPSLRQSILAEGAIALSVTLSGGALFAS